MLPMVEEKLLRDLLKDIIAYIRHLREDEGLYVSVHQIDQFAQALMHELKPYNYHECPYCNYVRQQEQVIAVTCIEKQKALCAKIGREPFFGTCWQGVGEFLFPLTDRGGIVCGFISVSGDAGAPEKTRAQTEKIARRYGLDADDMRAMQGTLRRDRPSMERMRAVVMPLTYMFTIMQSYLDNFAASFVGANLGQSELFDSICSFLRNHFSTDFKLSEVAKLFSVSESTLSHLFTAYSAYSYRGYINAMRVNIGKVYLRNTDVSVRQLSELLGYSTPNYFTAVFRKECGQTPEKYREDNRASSVPVYALQEPSPRLSAERP